MRPDHLLRAARRVAGVSQRELAERAGLSATGVAAIEAGRSRPTWDTMTRAAQAAGCSLSLVPKIPPLDAAGAAHLELTLERRLFLSLGATTHERDRRATVWWELMRLSRWAQLELGSRGAVGVWVQGLAPEFPLRVLARGGGLNARRAQPEVEHFDVVETPWQPEGDVWLAWPRVGRVIRIPDPIALSLLPECAEHATALRAGAAHLDATGRRDEQARRFAAHKDGHASPEWWF